MRARRLGVAIALGLAVAGALPAPAQGRGPTRTVAAPSQGGPGPVVADRALTANLDAVVAASPPDTCLTVLVDGAPVYRHDGTQPLVPASTQKVVTATVALEVLGSGTRFETSVVAPPANADGVVDGDVALVGGGDPALITDGYRAVRRLGPEVPATSLDELADQVAASGIRGISGRVLGDERRYDALRTVPGWPDRYAAQQQVGPLSALGVDEGYELAPPNRPDGPVRRVRADDPAASAARTFTSLLRARGILVAGEGASGPAPQGATRLASVTSPPVDDLVGRMLAASDNRIAEMLTKEVGRHEGGGGTTAAGVAAIAARADELGLTVPGTRVVDGSGLHPGNRATCDGLANVLHHGGGLDGLLGPSLPVAGRSGTLATRFRGNPAEGRMHAKTGSLNQVSALAGFVALPEGETATFAYVANQDPIDPSVRAVEDVLGAVLGAYVPPCRASGGADLVAPVAPYAAQVGSLSMFPLQSVLLPGAVLPLHVFEDRYRTLVDRCLAADEDFGVVLISRGSEVGGQDVRTEVGTRARIVQAEQAPDGRWGILALGMERLRVAAWLPDDPHPVADAEDWPDPDPGPEVRDQLEATEARLRRVLALRAELAEPGPSPTVPMEVRDPSLASHHLTALAPLGDLDRYRCLADPTIADRLARLDALLDEEEAVCRARLAGY